MNGNVLIYDYDTNRIRQELKHNGGVVRMKWHPNNVVLVTGCLDGCIYVWDVRSATESLHTLWSYGRAETCEMSRRICSWTWTSL